MPTATKSPRKPKPPKAPKTPTLSMVPLLTAGSHRWILSWTPAPGEEVLLRALGGGWHAVGYLSLDETAGNPLDAMDGMGKVYTRVGPKGAAADNGTTVPLEVRQHSATVYSVNHEGYQCQFDTVHDAGLWLPDEGCRDHIESKALLRQLPDCTEVRWQSSNPPGRSTAGWRLPSGRNRKGYKTFASAARGALRAMGRPIDIHALARDRESIAKDCARQGLDLYNAWNNGENYEICLESFDSRHNVMAGEDKCLSGLTGTTDALETLGVEFRDYCEGIMAEMREPFTAPRDPFED
jgi:hypothetical protein